MEADDCNTISTNNAIAEKHSRKSEGTSFAVIDLQRENEKNKELIGKFPGMM
jgi:hypothetical protein